MQDYLYHHNANTHWGFPTSVETDQALSAARQTFADFLNATPDEIVFGPNMTTDAGDTSTLGEEAAYPQEALLGFKEALDEW